ncbi:MAG: hypothetical protein HY248_05955, partial [Fimbriimonas ginsengisoli]|nr:hypothetical protein [Fimbriimonas ginsengisoli]
YLHQGSNAGPIVDSSGGGAPENDEAAIISPSVTGTGVYTVHTIYFLNTALIDQPIGTASVIRQASPIYLQGGMTFSPNQPNKMPGQDSSAEPSNNTDRFGNHYVSSIRGFPAGCDLWYYDLRPGSPTFDPYMRNPQYRGLIDGLTNSNNIQAGGDGGGDIALAVGRDAVGPNNVPTLAYASLIAANISTGNSHDLGQSFTRNPSGNSTGGVSVDDRQWIEFFGNNDVFLLYRTFEGAVSQIQHSTDAGVTYGPARSAGLIGQVGAITVDPNDGTVYCSGSTGRVAVGLRDPLAGEPVTYTSYQACTDANTVAHLFFVIKCASNGTVYGAYSNDKDVFLIYSRDHGQTWSAPMKIDSGPQTATSIFPALAVSGNPDTVGVAWYGTTDTANDDNANWNVFCAEVRHATSNSPIIRQVQASDHFIHAGNISEQGFGGNANRNLLDYFQISFDPLGACVVGYADDHNDFTGNCFSTRQISGESANGGRLPKPVEGSQLPTRQTQFSPDGSQVVDFLDDVTEGILVLVSTDDPLDILSIRYSNETAADGDKVIVAAMKVSTFNNMVPGSSWRMNFVANAPYSTMNASGLYSNALSDRGDQFFVRANYNADGSKSFDFGTTIRDSGGGLTYTVQGNADSGSFDPTTNTITVRVSASKLNPFVTHGPPIGTGSIIAGLRGATFTVSGDARRDTTFGGTLFPIQ